MIDDCSSDYTILNEDISYYGHNSSYLSLNDSFSYTKSSLLDSYPYAGIMNTYMGGGYVFKMKMADNSLGTGKADLLNKLNILENRNWIDRQTRAVFIEFTLFNPNLNLFSYCVILFEILQTGNLLSSSEYKPLNLNDIVEKNSISFNLLFNIFYIVLIILYMINEMRLIIREGKEYFKKIYNFIELAIIVFSVSAFVMYLYRLYSSYKIFDSINKLSKTNNGIMNAYINLQYISYCNDLLIYFMGLCAAFGTIRFIKLLRFSKKIVVFILAFKASFKEIFSFFLIFSVFWLAFAQIMYLILHEKSIQFSTLLSTMETCFQIILGKFQIDIMIKSNALFGSICFVLYNIIIVFVLVNLLISILTDYYNMTRMSNVLENEDPEILEYMSSLLSSLFKLKNKNDEENGENKKRSDKIAMFRKSVDNLVTKILKLYKKN